MEKTYRAYSVLTVKAANDDRRIITGVATTPQVDRVGDIVDPLGASFDRDLPLLWQHESSMPVGRVKFDKATKGGINFTAELPMISEEGTLRDRVEEAWQSVKYGLVRAVSIGFRAMQDGIEFIESGGLKFTKIEIYELSLVTIPANPQAIISAAKSIDAMRRLPGVSGPMPSKGVTLIQRKRP
jgi:HK97 family phage prohead protease